MHTHRKHVGIIRTLGILSALACLCVVVWRQYGAETGLFFMACCGSGILVGRWVSAAPATQDESSLALQRRKRISAQLYRVLNILTGHNLDHAFCFSLGGKRFYLCARCSGAFIGSFAGAWVLAIAWPGTSFPLGFALCLALPLVVDWTIQTLGFCESTNRRRLVTGILAGLGIASLRGEGALQLALAILVMISLVYAVSFFVRAGLLKGAQPCRARLSSGQVIPPDHTSQN
jgi:uncharacterized membrane protein